MGCKVKDHGRRPLPDGVIPFSSALKVSLAAERTEHQDLEADPTGESSRSEGRLLDKRIFGGAVSQKQIPVDQLEMLRTSAGSHHTCMYDVHMDTHVHIEREQADNTFY